MKEQWLRTALLLGEDRVEKLREKRAAVFGIGGVGGYAAEALARSGIGRLDLIDHDVVSVSNINRQIIALHSTVGRKKAEVMRERIQDIDPEIGVCVHDCFFLPETAGYFDFTKYDYVLDAVDTVAAKIAIVMKAKEEKVPVISCMGAGNKLDPSAFRVVDLYDTRICPLARVMRRELRKRQVESLKVVYSEEEPVKIQQGVVEEVKSAGRPVPGSVAFVPSSAGLLMAGEVIKDLVFSNRR